MAAGDRTEDIRWVDGIPQSGLTRHQVRALTAWHEAAHGVIGWTYGLELAYIAIDGSDGVPADAGGYTAWQAESFQHATWQQVAWTLAAGERAADRWLREAGLWTPALGWICEYSGEDDRAMAAALARDLPRPVHVTWGTSSSLADWHVICRQTDQLLDARWSAVCAAARYLLEHGRIEPDQITAFTRDLEVQRHCRPGRHHDGPASTSTPHRKAKP